MYVRTYVHGLCLIFAHICPRVLMHLSLGSRHIPYVCTYVCACEHIHVDKGVFICTVYSAHL